MRDVRRRFVGSVLVSSIWLRRGPRAAAVPGPVLRFDWRSSGVKAAASGAVTESLRETGRDGGRLAAGARLKASTTACLQRRGLPAAPRARLKASTTACLQRRRLPGASGLA